MEVKKATKSKQYYDLVENINEPILKRYMKDEFDFIINILKTKTYNIFDLGSGYGRVIPKIIDYSEHITAIEIDDDMFDALTRNLGNNANTTCIKSDITKLASYIELSNDMPNMFLLCQNTLGVIEGDYMDMLRDIMGLGKRFNCELVISVFNKCSIQEYGLFMYKLLEAMVGRIDLNLTNLDKGIFYSNTGYVSKWWTREEILRIMEIMEYDLVSEQETSEYLMYHFRVK